MRLLSNSDWYQTKCIYKTWATIIWKRRNLGTLFHQIHPRHIVLYMEAEAISLSASIFDDIWLRAELNTAMVSGLKRTQLTYPMHAHSEFCLSIWNAIPGGNRKIFDKIIDSEWRDKRQLDSPVRAVYEVGNGSSWVNHVTDHSHYLVLSNDGCATRDDLKPKNISIVDWGANLFIHCKICGKEAYRH